MKNNHNNEKKKSRLMQWIWVVLSTILNLIVLPISLFIGVMATDSGNEFDFVLGFLFLQGIPLLLLIISIIFAMRSKNNFGKNKNQ